MWGDPTMKPETTSDEQPDSIKLIKNSKGYHWEIKRYYSYDKTQPQDVMQQLKDIDTKLKNEYGSD